MPRAAPLYFDIDTSGTSSDWPLPAGTEIGDTVILWGLADVFTVSDPRFTWHLPHSYDVHEGGWWIGKVDTLDPISGSVTAGLGAKSANARLLTMPDRVFTRRINHVDAGAAPVHTVPIVGGGGTGALVLSVAAAGIGGSGGCGVSGADSWISTVTNSDYEGAGHAWTDVAPLSGGTVTVTWGPVSAPLSFASIMVGTGGGGYAPPCRNIKRGDVLDLGGARNYPPSKMQQTSSRGVGAY